MLTLQVAGLPLAVAYHKDEIPILMEEAAARLKSSLNAIKLANSGIAVQASTLGSLEAMLDFLKGEKIPVAAIGIGPVHKRHVIGASIQMEKDGKYGVMLAFDVVVDRDAEVCFLFLLSRDGVFVPFL
jgi:translation initiation factor 5B